MSFSGELGGTAGTEALLQRAEANLVARRKAEAEQLQIARRWAMAHQRAELGDDVREIGAMKLRIWEFAPAELAMAWEMHPLAAQRLMADAFDLSLRMPYAWDAVRDSELPAWVARQLIKATKDLPGNLAREVDEALRDDYETLSPGRLLGAAEGRIAAAKPKDADERAEAERKLHLVHASRPVDGSATFFARLDAVDAGRLYESCDTIAELLATSNGDQEQLTRDQLRAKALGILADPQAALDLLHGRDPRRGKAVVYVHMTPQMLADRVCGIARVEDLGPHTKQMLRDLLGHDHITLKPVIDLADDVSSDAYEVPAALAERVHLAKPADVYPWAVSVGRKVDLDHTIPWPFGHTEIANLAKLTRRHHRIKTHGGWDVDRLPGDRYLWRSPHGRYVLVDNHGTHEVAAA